MVKKLPCNAGDKVQSLVGELGFHNPRPQLKRSLNLYAGQEATVRTGHGTTGSKYEKEYIKAVYCHLAYLTYMQST